MGKKKKSDLDRLHVAVVQCALNEARQINVARVVGLIREAAATGAKVIVPPELFETPYFPSEQEEDFFEWARPLEGNKTHRRLEKIARELGVVLIYSWFEKAGQAHYNSAAVIDADGTTLGIYRKSHIPDGPGYHEKYYFHPGDSGFKVWSTQYGTIGVGICWDQWFPECARAMALQGAELLVYPTAIGSEPKSGEDTLDPWQRVMIGHAVASSVPVAAANRVGDEDGLLFYGASFIADPRGDKVAELDRTEQGVAHHVFDRAALAKRRASWGFFRDRRPGLYGALMTSDGDAG